VLSEFFGGDVWEHFRKRGKRSGGFYAKDGEDKGVGIGDGRVVFNEEDTNGKGVEKFGYALQEIVFCLRHTYPLWFSFINGFVLKGKLK